MSAYGEHQRGVSHGMYYPGTHSTPPSNGRRPSDLDSSYTNPFYEHRLNGDEHVKRADAGHNNTNSNSRPDSNVAIHRPRLNRKSSPGDKSSLTTKFDPMKDRHMWAMWRTAVNGRIVDQVRRNEKYKIDAMAPESSSTVGSDGRTFTYGKDLASDPPLSRFIRLNQRSKNIAQGLVNEGHGELQTTQFIYYGLPRVTVNTNNFKLYSNDHHPLVNGGGYDGYNNNNIMSNGYPDTNDFKSKPIGLRSTDTENAIPYQSYTGR